MNEMLFMIYVQAVTRRQYRRQPKERYGIPSRRLIGFEDMPVAQKLRLGMAPEPTSAVYNRTPHLRKKA